MWLGECDNQFACWEWQSIGWGSVAISLHTGIGDQIAARVWRSAGVLGMATNGLGGCGDQLIWLDESSV